MDAMQHCGWNSITRAAEEVGAKIPALPNNVQTKFHGYKCLGDFGDGYVIHALQFKIVNSLW